MYRFKFFLNFDKEEQWLEAKARDGYHLKGTFMGYQFYKGQPEETNIKIDFRKFRRKEDFLDYCTLFKDSGWQHLVGTKNSGIQYFKKIEGGARDDIFSDNDSEALRYKRYAKMFSGLAISFIPLLIIFYLTDLVDFKAFANPKSLYYTPGLWEKEGFSFWFSFLFESPFALMRGFIWLVIPVSIICYFIFAYKSKQLYVEKKEQG